MKTASWHVSRTYKVVMILCAGVFVSGCGIGQSQPTVTPTSTSTPVPSATAAPTMTATAIHATSAAGPTGKLLFSDTFDDNRNNWNLTDEPGLVNINDGSLEIVAGEHDITGARVPMTSSPADVVISVDIQVSPPPGAAPKDLLPFAGAGCRASGNSLYFLGVSVLPASGFFGGFISSIMEVNNASMNALVDPMRTISSAPDARIGKWFSVSFVCFKDAFRVVDSRGFTMAKAQDSSLQKGSILILLSRIKSSAERARFDNLRIMEATGP
jgi:hypothetical protein